MTLRQQSNGDRRKPPQKPPTTTGSPHGGIPPELLAPAIEGPIILPKRKPKVVRGE